MFKANLTLFISILTSICLAQQPGDMSQRTDLDPNLAPFYHGVASGDPLPESVVIWTRYTPDQNPGAVDINWAIATDTGMNQIVQSGIFNTDADRDYTVKIDVNGLDPNSWYYYRFTYENRNSIVGRTRTTALDDIDSLRFAVVSCSDYVDGYFHAYRRLAERNDIDAVIHLGDYIYENGSTGSIGRPHDPPERINELNDYRQRYSQYRLDEDLRCVHQMYPFINVWDDHEIANNSWQGGAEAHDNASDGVYELRKKMAVQAFYEWLPIRHPDPQDSIRIYRSIPWGNLLELFMIDTRIIGRDEQASGNAIDDPTRSLIGPQQLAWLSERMQNSNAQWKIIGQQVMMAPLEAPFFGPLNTDQWDGYRAERNRLYDTIMTKGIEDVVVLTGDIHTAWANNLEHNNDAVGVEFVAHSVTTQNAPFAIDPSIISGTNPHIQYVDLTGHGYFILDVNTNRTQADFHFVGDIEDENAYDADTAQVFWYTNAGDGFLQEGQMESTARSTVSVLQPSKTPNQPTNTSIESEDVDAVVFGTYPNPFWQNFMIKTYLTQTRSVQIEVINSTGQTIETTLQNTVQAGLHYFTIDGTDYPSGIYTLQMKIGDKLYQRKVVKL